MILAQTAAVQSIVEPAFYSVVVIIASAVIAATQWVGWWRITQLNGEIKSLSAIVAGIPNAVSVQVSNAMEKLWHANSGLESRVTGIERVCEERHGYRAQGPISPPHGVPVYRETESMD